MVRPGAQPVDRRLRSGENGAERSGVEAEGRCFRQALENGESVRLNACVACGVSCHPLASWGSTGFGTEYTAVLRELSPPPPACFG